MISYLAPYHSWWKCTETLSGVSFFYYVIWRSRKWAKRYSVSKRIWTLTRPGTSTWGVFRHVSAKLKEVKFYELRNVHYNCSSIMFWILRCQERSGLIENCKDIEICQWTASFGFETASKETTYLWKLYYLASTEHLIVFECQVVHINVELYFNFISVISICCI